jgi:hypothetical protein
MLHRVRLHSARAQARVRSRLVHLGVRSYGREMTSGEGLVYDDDLLYGHIVDLTGIGNRSGVDL